GSFVERQKSLDRLAAWVCRQEADERDVVFVQGGPGSGKPALLAEFLRRLRLANAQAMRDDDSSRSLLIATRLYLREEVERTPDEYRDPVPGLIDLEFSFGNRMGTVRRAIRDALVDALLWEECINA